MIDLHSHLLPGVDDGSPSVEASLPVLQGFERDGVEVLVCTPHLQASTARAAPHERYGEILAGLVASAPARPRLMLGWEIMLDEPDVDLRDRRLGLGGSTAVLVEFPRTNVPAGAARELFRLRMSGLVPVLAHPERYWGCTVDQIREWRRVGAVIQMDAVALLGGPDSSRLAHDMLAEGLVDCIASDNHGDARSLKAARDWLVEIGAEAQAAELTRANAERLLANQAVLPVEPVAVPRGMLRRLRELVLGRR